MKRVVAAVVVALLVVAVVAGTLYVTSFAPKEKKPFYVGITYGGNSTAEAEQMIDKVKNYTNLFVIQSSPIQQNRTALTEVCDYAVNSGLNVIVYFSSYAGETAASFANSAQARWGSHFLGVYINDEPGGRMLDFGMGLYNTSSGEYVTKQTGYYSVTLNVNGVSTFVTYCYTASNFELPGAIATSVNVGDDTVFTTFYPNGTIKYYTARGDDILFYQPDGSVRDFHGKPVTGVGDVSQFASYAELWEARPLKTDCDVSKLYVDTQQHMLSSIHDSSSVKLFTSDYALDWYDYLGGYDVVLGELGWNQSTTQNIALVRGAAEMQNKSWGAMIAWESQTIAPYMQSGEQIYAEAKQAYEAGATYVVVFNYSPNDAGLGLMQDEHFEALRRFWADVVQNPRETNNARGEAALVLPKDCGWGMRRVDDTAWGLWKPDDRSEQLWSALQTSLSRYGTKLDIVFDDPAFPLSGHYSQLYYWNQTA